MEISLFIFISILWFLSGCFSFIYWWTKDHDFTINEIIICIVTGFMGVLSFLLGYMIHGKNNICDVVIIKRKE